MKRRPHFSDRAMLMTLRRASQGESTISKHTYDQRRAGADPSVPLYERRFGSWNKALSQAGLQTVEQPLQLQGASPKCWSDEQMLTAIRICYQAMSSTALAAYESWRTAQPTDERERSIPAASSIRYRFGRWSRATDLALATTSTTHTTTTRRRSA